MGISNSTQNNENMFCCNCQRDDNTTRNQYTNWIDLAIYNNKESIDDIKNLMKHQNNRGGISRNYS